MDNTKERGIRERGKTGSKERFIARFTAQEKEERGTRSREEIGLFRDGKRGSRVRIREGTIAGFHLIGEFMLGFGAGAD